jgi:hypothetical protein
VGFSTNQPSDYFAVGVQPAKDVEATSFYFAKHLDGTAVDISEDVTSEREGGDGQEVGLRYKTMIKADGALNANARPGALDVGFAGALGRTATVMAGGTNGIPSGCQLVRYAPNPTLPYLTVEQRFADQIERTTNNKVNSLELSGEAGKPIKLAFNLVSGGTPYWRDTASALTPQREVGDPIFFPRGSYVIDGVGNTKITKFSVKAARNLDDAIQTTQLFREDLVELNADYDLDFTLKYEDKTFYRKIKAAGGTTVPLALATGSFEAYMVNPAAADNPGATLARSGAVRFPLIQYAGAKVNKLDPDGKTVYLDVSAMTIKGATDSLIADVVVPSRANLV